MQVKFFDQHFVVYVVDVVFVVTITEKYKLLRSPENSDLFGKTIIAVDKAPR